MAPLGVINTDSGEYKFSKPIFVRRWAGGKGFISVKVGYVSKHPEINCVLLEKKWVGKGGKPEGQRFIIKGEEDWLKIKGAIEDLWPEIVGVLTPQEIDRAVEKISEEAQLLELIAKYPDLLSQIPKDVDILSLPAEQKEALRKLLAAGGDVANSVIKKLSEQPFKDLEQFVLLLKELKLSSINSLVTHITSRIGFIDMFEKAIHDDKSYERRGAGSIHNLLKANIWIVDRNFSVLHDDETLKKIIFENWGKKIGEKNRPDFLCMADQRAGERSYREIVIIEIKRPSVKVEFAHIKQLMDYRTILQANSGKRIEDFKCYLVGREVDRSLQVNDLSKSGFVVKAYTDFIGEARRFYKEYLEIVEKEEGLSV